MYIYMQDDTTYAKCDDKVHDENGNDDDDFK